MCHVCASFTKNKHLPNQKVGLTYSNLDTGKLSAGLLVTGKAIQDVACLFGGCYTAPQNTPDQGLNIPVQKNRSSFQMAWINLGGLVAKLIGKG